MRLVLIALSAALVISNGAAAQVWSGAWGWAPAGVSETPTGTPRADDRRGPLGPAVVSNATLRQIVRVTADGGRVRLRVSNEFGAAPLVLGAVRVAKGDADHPVTFGGKSVVTIPAGAPYVSDPVDLPVKAFDKLAVSLFLPNETALPGHRLRQRMAAGDQTAARIDTPVMRLGALITGVEVERSRKGVVIAAIGDSITEGSSSTPDAWRAWPDQLADRLKSAAVVNVGIGGNRLLNNISGSSGLSRFDRDVLAVPGVTHAMVLEGINDIGRATRPEFAHQPVIADDLINGYRQLIARAHARGLKIIGATIPPYEGANYFTEGGEATRQAVNAWIRTSKAFDGYADFDAATRDPANPRRLRAEFQSGDWLHPSDAGYAAMAAAVDPKLFD
ncbi:SGNH/GDSL hydrolase family protein [Caulobacter segnis]|uniref:SGNH/GDSL hydrolase family protein n=1 Tax=Caulobacter segnis TaxID=88688 RepID=UPI00240FC21F|nr:SGNH/GDSL hydrolase family protein [Caulobacter segnis]MDG2522090.1 SGNH/GDSL hydrolase family protein [Caulobacter segnis]